MDLTAAFLGAVSHQMQAEALSPSALARAAVDLLPVDAAGLSTLLEVIRLPLGASSVAARVAEELQTSLGEGPCLSAAVTGTTRVVDQAELIVRWPLYGEELTRRTPFRSVAAIPLSTPQGEVFAALDLYAEDAHLSGRLDLGALDQHVAAPAAALLAMCMGEVRGVDLDTAMPDWYHDATAHRHDVWVAVGMVMGRRAQPTQDALDLLRAAAFTRARSLDALAGDLVAGRLTLDELIG